MILASALLGAVLALSPSCPADLNGSGVVDAADLSVLLGAWGDAGRTAGLGDLDGDGMVGASDLAILLGAWGECAEPPACLAPAWIPGFTTPGTSNYPNATAVFDDGSGPRLYVAGSLTSAGGLAVPSKVATWDGANWSALPGTIIGTVRDLIIYDDGNAESLIVAGSITSLDGASIGRIARWDGHAWSTLGAGVSATIFALAVFDDGQGPAIYAGGSFTSAGGHPANHVARWDGVEWSPLGAGVNGTVYALGVHDDGSGPSLYVGGDFTTAGAAPANRVARWDGKEWSALGVGTSSAVRCFRSVGDELPSASGLVVGGLFSEAGGVPAGGVARWTGGAWSALGTGAGTVEALEVYDDGSGPALHCGGSGGLRRLNVDSSAWLPVSGGGTNGSVTELAVFDDGRGLGPGLFASGPYTVAGGLSAYYIARHDASGWRALGNGVDGVVFDIARFDDGRGDGPVTFITGAFEHAGGVPAKNIARWDGDRWEALGGGIGSTVLSVGYALEVYDDSTGPALFVGGNFGGADGISTKNIARWDGHTWSALGTEVVGVNSEVYALAVFNTGQGNELFVAGAFTTAGGIQSPGLARWNGSEWIADSVGGGFYTLRVLNDVVSGVPTLYAGSGGGFAANDGTGWTFPLLGLGGDVLSFARYEDTDGPKLVIGGSFTSIEGVSASRVAQWDGAAWSPLGGGMTGTFDSTVWSLDVFDDGSGPRLHAGGQFRYSDGLLATNLAAWDGVAWSPIGAGVGVPLDSDDRVYTLLALPGSEQEAASLLVGGTFTLIDGRPGSNFAVRGCQP